MTTSPSLIPIRRLASATALLIAGVAIQSPEARAQSNNPVSTGTNAPVYNGPSWEEFNAQKELINKLLQRIDQLEQTETERAAATKATVEALQKNHETREQKLQGRIGELETKVGSLEAGRVLPEIVLSPEDGPTTSELDQQIRILARNSELAAEAAEARAKELPQLSVGQNGITFTSADKNFRLQLRGLLQLDSRTFFNDSEYLRGNDGFVLRRARPIFEGTLFRDFDFQIVPDFGGSSTALFDANLNYRLRPEVQFKLGKFKAPIGFEQLQSDATTPFNERSLASAFIPSRAVGVQVWGNVADGAATYAIGVFNGTGDGRNSSHSDFGDDYDIAGRIFVQPFKQLENIALQGIGFGFGASYSLVNSNALGLPGTTGGTLPGYATDGQQQFFAYNPVIGPVVADGKHWRLAPQATYLLGPFGFLGEYTLSRQEVYNSATFARGAMDHSAWQVSAQWVLTGEPASFTGITPRNPFDFASGRWGAWQLVARYGQLDIDDGAFLGFSNPQTSARGATAWSVGINWWLNKNVRVLTSFSHTTFDGGGAFNPVDPTHYLPPGTVTQNDEDVFFTRVQISF